jgi:iron complex transport system substrate-binding protein
MRIASLAPGITETLCALGCAGEIACVTEDSDYPAEVRSLPAAGSGSAVSIEKLRKCGPEVVFTATASQERLAGQLRAAGFRVEHHDPRSLQQVFDGIMAIGRLTKKAKAARDLLAGMRRRLQAIQKRVDGLERPRTYCEDWQMPPTAAQPWVAELVEIAGGLPYGRAGTAVDMADLTRFDPELIILHWTGFGARSQPWQVLQRQDWAHLTALRRKRVYVVQDALLNRPGPRLVDGCETLAALLHPEALKEREETLAH